VITLALVSNAWSQKKNAAASNEPAYYTPATTPIFNPFPNVTDKKRWLVRNLGPVGIGIMLVRPGMTMQINNVEIGSPAEATGKLQKGQIIESINGKVLKEVDPRIILGDIVTEAEAKDGTVVLKIQGAGDVTVGIPVMGSYSKTWPVNCPKSDKIVRNLADLIAKQDQPKWGSVIFLLSTGEEKDLDVVKRWMKGIKNYAGMNWDRGYKGPGLCEYYLRTGDQSVLPVIKQMTEELRVNMFSGGWSGRAGPAAFTYSVGTGQVHASGVNCMSFLLMAKLCGVEVDKYMFDETFSQFYRFAGHGNVAYGNTLPEGGFRDNGKTSGLAFGLGAAAMVDPAGEDSVYAKARDNSATKAFYATNTGALMTNGAKTIRSRIGAILQEVPGGEEFVRHLPRTTQASHISGKDSDMYSYEKFTPNPAVVGTWAWAVYPQPGNPSEIDARIAAFMKANGGKGPDKIENAKDTIQLLDGGKVAKSKFFGGYFWSGDMLIGVNDDQALKMEVRKVGGRDFLIIERGGFNAVPDTEEAATARVSKDWHCGYHVYVRQ
jgi:hypothetical protein